jgi:hypothetical protein
MVNPTAYHSSAPNHLIEGVGRHPSRVSLAPAGAGASVPRSQGPVSPPLKRWPAPSPPGAWVTRPPAWRSGTWATSGSAASAQAARFAAALQSRSMTSPQPSQRKVRVPNAMCCATLPHLEQVLVEGNQRSHTTRSPPSQAVLYRSWRANSDQAASVMARARRLLRIRLATGRSSRASPLWVLVSWLETS